MQAKILDARPAARQLVLWSFGLVLLLAAGLASAQTFTTPVTSSVTVPLSGKPTTKKEAININGTARINTTTVPDLDFRGTPLVLVTIDFLSLSGVGVSSGGKYTVVETIQKIRRLAPTDTVDVTFPIQTSAADLATALIGQATFQLTFDTNSGQLTAASGSVASSPY